MTEKAKSRSGRKVKPQPAKRQHTRWPLITGMKELVRKRWKCMSLVAMAVLLAGIWIMLGERGTIDIDIDTSSEFVWAKLEPRDAEGRLTFPAGAVEGTTPLRWADRNEEGIDSVMLLTGYHPSPVLGLWNKLYYVERVSYGNHDAWQRSARITIHLSLGREYEAEWFKHMWGRTLHISSVQDPLQSPQILRIEEIQFGRKTLEIVADGKRSERLNLLEASITAREPIFTALYNTTLGTMTKGKVSTFLGSLLAGVLAAVLATLFLRWLLR